MLDIKKNYIGTFPEFRETISQLQKKDVPRTIRQRVTVLESKEVKQRHTEVRAELGLDENLHSIKQTPVEREIDGAAGDPKFYKEVLGQLSLSWEEI